MKTKLDEPGVDGFADLPCPIRPAFGIMGEVSGGGGRGGCAEAAGATSAPLMPVSGDKEEIRGEGRGQALRVPERPADLVPGPGWRAMVEQPPAPTRAAELLRARLAAQPDLRRPRLQLHQVNLAADLRRTLPSLERALRRRLAHRSREAGGRGAQGAVVTRTSGPSQPFRPRRAPNGPPGRTRIAVPPPDSARWSSRADQVRRSRGGERQVVLQSGPGSPLQRRRAPGGPPGQPPPVEH